MSARERIIYLGVAVCYFGCFAIAVRLQSGVVGFADGITAFFATFVMFFGRLLITLALAHIVIPARRAPLFWVGITAQLTVIVSYQHFAGASLVVAGFIAGAGSGLALHLLKCAAAEITDKPREITSPRFVVACQVGTFGGAILGSMGGSNRIHLIEMAITVTASLVVMIGARHLDSISSEMASNQRVKALFIEVETPIQDAALQRMVMVLCLFWLAYSLILGSFPLLARVSGRIDLGTLFFWVSGILSILFQTIVFRWLSAKLSLSTLMTMGLIALGLAAVMPNFGVSTIGTIVMATFFCISQILFVPAADILCLNARQSSRGCHEQALAVVNASRNVAHMTGISLAGPLYAAGAATGLTSGIWLLSALCAGLGVMGSISVTNIRQRRTQRHG